MEARKLSLLTITDYLHLEQETDTRYEFHAGQVFAMAGGTVEHSLLSANVVTGLNIALRKKGNGCLTFSSDLKLHIAASNKFLYPDAMVVCGEIKRSEKTPHAITNPTLIVEVLSESTESYDRGDKFFAYRQIPDLKAYLLIDQYKPQVDLYQREGDLWRITRVEGLEHELEIPSLEVKLSLAHLYEGVRFPTPDEAGN